MSRCSTQQGTLCRRRCLTVLSPATSECCPLNLVPTTSVIAGGAWAFPSSSTCSRFQCDYCLCCRHLLCCRMFHPLIFECGQIHLNLRINLGIHHKVLSRFFTHRDVLNQFFIHHDVQNQFFIHHDILNQFFIHHDVLVTFPSSPTFLLHQNHRITFANVLLENIETCPIQPMQFF